MLLAHATGFCKEVWDPLVDELQRLGSITSAIAWDFYSHGSSPPLKQPVDWWQFAEQVADMVTGTERPRVGVGHSMGAAALAMAEVAQPGSFDRLVLVEPIAFPPPFAVLDDNPMSNVARKRRNYYESRAEALANFKDKPVFAAWDERALDGYVAGGLVPSAHGYELACAPGDEAAIFAAAYKHDLYDRFAEVTVPATIGVGELSTTLTAEYADHLVARLGGPSRLALFEGATHFVPMERPAELARVVHEELAAVRR